MQELATVGDHIYSHTSFTMEQGCKSWQQWETTSIVMPALPWYRDARGWQQWETTSIVMPALPWYRDARVGNSGRPHL